MVFVKPRYPTRSPPSPLLQFHICYDIPATDSGTIMPPYRLGMVGEWRAKYNRRSGNRASPSLPQGGPPLAGGLSPAPPVRQFAPSRWSGFGVAPALWRSRWSLSAHFGGGSLPAALVVCSLPSVAVWMPSPTLARPTLRSFLFRPHFSRRPLPPFVGARGCKFAIP